MVDIIVIGGGVAGMTSALYALRQNKSVTLIEKNGIGGQVAEAPKVENFPTIKSISGAELADRLFEQITNLGVNFEFGDVLSVEKSGEFFKVKTEFNVFEAKSVIIATGVEHRKLNLEGEEKLIGHGISYCALCDGAFYKGQDVVLVGDGNTALQYALLLAGYTKSVHIVTLFDRFFGDASLVEALKTKPNIKITHNAKLVKLVGEDSLEGLVFEDKNKTQFEIKTNGLFVAIGQVPNNEKFANLADLNKDGYFVANADLSTKTLGLFVAGDCREKSVRQLTTAASDGAIAATSACNYLFSK